MITADDQGHLNIVGGVTASKQKCIQNVPVKVQKYKQSTGKWVKKGSGMTDNTGYYEIPVNDAEGRYRSIAVHIVKGNDVCLKDISNAVSTRDGPHRRTGVEPLPPHEETASARL
jgi:hypothetical protein